MKPHSTFVQILLVLGLIPFVPGCKNEDQKRTTIGDKIKLVKMVTDSIDPETTPPPAKAAPEVMEVEMNDPILVAIPSETRPTPARTEPKAVSEAILTDLAHQIETAVRGKDTEFFDNVFDWDKLIQRSTVGLTVPNGFKQGAKAGLDRMRPQFAAEICNSRINFIESRQHDDSIELLFRLRDGETLDYKIFIVEQNPQDDWKIVDAITIGGGTKMSELLRSIFAPMITELERSKGTGKSALRSDRLAGVQKLVQMGRLATAGQTDAALQMWSTIDAEVRKEKASMLVWIRAASTAEDSISENSEYARALAEFASLYPDDSSLPFLMLDFHVIKKDFDTAHESISTIKAQMNDPYLDFYRGWLYLAEENYTKAEEVADEWAKASPNDHETWEMMLVIGLETRKNHVIAESLLELEAGFGFDYGHVLTLPEYQPFLKSFEGRAWASNRG